MVIELPWPPSVNHYWRRRGNTYFVSAEGKRYRDQVFCLTFDYRKHFAPEDRLMVSIDAYPPDRRRRDLDNLLKSLLDSLQYAEIYADDNQIDFLAINRNASLDGKVKVHIKKV